MIVESGSYREFDYEIMYDEDPESPREWDQIGQMVCFHSKYDLGDKHEYKQKDYNSWEEVLEAIKAEWGDIVYLPLYLYDHSGITMSTTPFACKWDSGQVGWVFTVKGFENMEDKLLLELLKSEVAEYDTYLRGEVYGFMVYNKDGGVEDSCFGFYCDIDEVIREIESDIDYLTKED